MSSRYTAFVTDQDEDLSPRTYGLVLVLEAAIILLLWILGRTFT